jgi:3-oxoacyl-[acyl-carrier-protein] synthase II
MTSDIFCSTATVATTFDVACDPLLVVDLLPGDELRKLERRYRSQAAAVVVHAFQTWRQRAGSVLPDPARRGVVLGSATGAGPDIEIFLDNSISVGDHLVNPGLFPMTVHHAAAGIAAIAAECQGPNVVVSAGLGSAWAALDAACAFLRDGGADLVFVGGFESQTRAPDTRGSVAAVVALAAAPATLGRSYRAPLSALLGGADPQHLAAGAEDGADERSSPARIAALVAWAEVFAPPAAPDAAAPADAADAADATAGIGA